MWQKHEYTIRVTGSKKVRLLFCLEHTDSLESVHLSFLSANIGSVGQVVESILVIDFDEEGKIARMIDQRQGMDPPTRWGAQQLRRLNGRVTPWVPWLGSHPKARPNCH